jgi:hypothetical protein
LFLFFDRFGHQWFPFGKRGATQGRQRHTGCQYMVAPQPCQEGQDCQRLRETGGRPLRMEFEMALLLGPWPSFAVFACTPYLATTFSR